MDIGLGYVALAVIALGLLAFDLYNHRKPEEVSIKSAALWSGFYVLAALGFALYINFQYSTEWAQLFLTGYALEKVLAVDNLFAFMIIFSYFGIASKFQHNILYWGILGAIIFRGVFVVLGTSFTALFGPWALLIFAAIIGYTAIKMLQGGGEDGDEAVDYADKWYIKGVKRFLPVTEKTDGGKFFLKLPTNAGKTALFATPMFLCLIAIEVTDVVFAFDSVPAVIAVTKEPFLVYSAMIFAILGLRSLYFVLEALRRVLSRLETAVIFILLFIAGKLTVQAGSTLVHDFTGAMQPIHIDPLLSLAIVMTLLVGGVIWSLVSPVKEDEAEAA
ncbi:tellurite resistance protein [Brevundimonas phage vB_BpoS-Marchewka]|uniref:Tellurite resistance protein n=1 Tax=Brevundimonas phage vB_BpoS-Marchewka TaxID=2948604 RepID=A0A9E7N310_9CAUD|nr:tellurite resistance protein [Brevundimonas phage vB_BpoS-Marchewka]UTC29390.1 tellurite resistance protein [Brevundimonas phage vB_BpoS-Bambus]